MNRSSRAQLSLGLVGLMALAVALVTVASPSPANAQDGTGASITLHASGADTGQAFRTIAVALEPGQTGLAALGASLQFDTDAVVVHSCAVSEVGACNVIGGQVLVSVFNLANLKTNEQLLTINFEGVPGATGQTGFELVVTTAVTAQGTQLADITGDTIEVALTAAGSGSLTGTVVAEDTATALFAVNVCVTHVVTGGETCTTTSGLGNWRIDDLALGTYAVVASDEVGVYASRTGTGDVLESQTVLVDEFALPYVADEPETGQPEAGQPEAGQPEAGQPEAGQPEAGQPEAGQPEAGQPEAGQPEAEAAEGPVPTPEPTPTVVAETRVQVVYGASITGRITAMSTEAPIEAAQVCATQPFVLHQSCATADANGEYEVTGLSTGNYWIEVVDPLGQFQQTRRKLVGIVGDEVTRDGVNVVLRSIAE